tara:strand:+ start:10799 stop:11146 length:348 start_codon:yes stop_codon:yes gene_type:complete
MGDIFNEYELNPLSREERLILSSHRGSKKCSSVPCSEYTRYINFIMNIASCAMLFISMVIVISITSDSLALLSDSKETIIDLKLIIPEIKNTLHILQTLCSHDEFKSYCYVKELV